MKKNEVSPSKMAFEFINSIYQPTGHLKIDESPDYIWNWCKCRAKNVIEVILSQLDESQIDFIERTNYWNEVLKEIENQ